MTERKFTRLVDLGQLNDPRRWSMRRALPEIADDELPDFRRWDTGPVHDQGTTSQCVAYSGVGLLEAAPVEVPAIMVPDFSLLYHKAQSLDPWPGHDYDGTTVEAGVKALREWGYVSEYYFAESVDVIRKWLLTRGPVWMGTTWTTDMNHPDHGGRVKPTGTSVGGHAWLAIGWDDIQGGLIGRNSWGYQWGIDGDFYIDRASVEFLLSNMGEAVAAVETPLKPNVATPAEILAMVRSQRDEALEKLEVVKGERNRLAEGMDEIERRLEDMLLYIDTFPS